MALPLTLAANSVGRLLAQIGITCQKPLHRAIKRDESLVRQWLKRCNPSPWPLRETHRAQPGLAFDKLIEMPRNVSQARRNAFPRPWPYAEAESMNTGPCDASCPISIASSKRPFMSITWSRLLTFTSTFSGFGAYFVTIACRPFRSVGKACCSCSNAARRSKPLACRAARFRLTMVTAHCTSPSQ